MISRLTYAAAGTVIWMDEEAVTHGDSETLLYLKCANDNHWLTGGSPKTQLDLCFDLCFTSNLTRRITLLNCTQWYNSKAYEKPSILGCADYLWVMDEALSIPCVGWELACAGLLKTLNNGLQHNEIYTAGHVLS